MSKPLLLALCWPLSLPRLSNPLIGYCVTHHGVSPCHYVIHLRYVTYALFLFPFLFLSFLLYHLLDFILIAAYCFAFRPSLFSGAFGASALASECLTCTCSPSMVTFQSNLYIISWTSFISSIKMAKLLSSLSLWLLTADLPVHSRCWLRIRCPQHCQTGMCCPHLRCTTSNPQVS